MGLSRTLCGRFRSCGDEDALPEQVKASTAVHGALDRLQPIDLTLGGAGAPGRGNGCDHGRLVALDAPNETVQRAATSGLYPGLQRCVGAVDIRAALAQEVGEGVGNVSGAHQLGCESGEMGNEGLLLGVEPISRHAKHPGATPGRGRWPDRGRADRIRCSRTLLWAPARRPPFDTPHAAAEALGAEFAPELCGVVAALVPAAAEISLVWPDIAGLPRPAVCRWSASLQPATDRAQAGADGTADCLLRQALLLLLHHLLVAEPTVVAPVRPAEVPQQMPPIRYLERVRRALPCRIGIGTSTVTCDSLDPTMLLQPGRDRASLAVGQQVDNPVALQIHQDGPVALAAPPRPIIDRQ